MCSVQHRTPHRSQLYYALACGLVVVLWWSGLVGQLIEMRRSTPVSTPHMDPTTCSLDSTHRRGKRSCFWHTSHLSPTCAMIPPIKWLWLWRLLPTALGMLRGWLGCGGGAVRSLRSRPTESSRIESIGCRRGRAFACGRVHRVLWLFDRWVEMGCGMGKRQAADREALSSASFALTSLRLGRRAFWFSFWLIESTHEHQTRTIDFLNHPNPNTKHTERGRPPAACGEGGRGSIGRPAPSSQPHATPSLSLTFFSEGWRKPRPFQSALLRRTARGGAAARRPADWID